MNGQYTYAQAASTLVLLLFELIAALGGGTVGCVPVIGPTGEVGKLYDGISNTSRDSYNEPYHARHSRMDKTNMALQRCGYGILQGANSRLSRCFMREGREVSAQEIVGLGDRDVDRVPVTSRRDGGGR